MFNISFTKTPYSFELMPQVVSIPNHRPRTGQSSLLLFCTWIAIILYLSPLYGLSTIPIQTLWVRNAKSLDFLFCLFMQPPINCPPTFLSCISAIFYLPISPPNMFIKPSLQTLLTFSSFIPQPFFTSLAVHAVSSTATTKTHCPISTIPPFQTLPKAQWSKKSCDLL